MMTQPPRINHRPPLIRLTNDTRALAERMGSETTAALVRAAAGVRMTTETVACGGGCRAGTLGRTAGEGIAGGVRAAAFPSVGARGAFRMGRFVGRIEGAVKLALFAAAVAAPGKPEAGGRPGRPTRSLAVAHARALGAVDHRDGVDGRAPHPPSGTTSW